MPIHVNGVNITSVNVNGSPINYVNVNGTNVWSREWDYYVPISNMVTYDTWNIEGDGYSVSIYGWNRAFGGVYFDIDCSKVYRVEFTAVNYISDAGTGRYYSWGLGTSTSTLPSVYTTRTRSLWFGEDIILASNVARTYTIPVSSIATSGICRIYAISATHAGQNTCNSALGWFHVFGRG